MSGLEGLLTGQTLVKRYRIREVIGRGGFAAVYRADDERLGRPVAVKVITVPAPDAEAAERHRERFEREARAAASLPQHPNVVTVHDFGIDPVLGLDFLVMEFLHGEDLATRLRREGRPPLEEAVRILRDAAAGLAVGHRAGVVHRDVKPGNIFLARGEGAEGLRVCILDFGIARVVAEDYTLTGAPGEGMPLSPAYASPEQSRGARDLSAASDVFSLGVVAYQLLTGEKPFTVTRTLDPSEWIPRRAIRELNPGVPERLEAVVWRALAYAPGDRYADAEDFAAALAAPMPVSGALGPVAGPEGVDPTLIAPPIRPDSTEADRTLFQPPTEAVPVSERHAGRAYPNAPATSRPWSRAAPLMLLLLLAAGAAGWWFLRGDAAPLDPSAAEDLEIVTEELEENPSSSSGAAAVAPPPGAAPASPADTLEVRFPDAFGPTLEDLPGSTDGGVSDADTATTFPGAPDTAGQPPVTPDTLPQPATAPDTAAAPPPAETILPPPRVIGVPIDSLPAPREPPGSSMPSAP